jgi:4-amino-4-deoxy-L-arabinose transferase-like glycosyltransferase
VQTDEGTYLGRAMMTLRGLGLHEAITTPQHDSIDEYTRPYDHPFFGQIFLAGALGTISYPDLFTQKPVSIHFIESLYLVPRILMGLLAVTDTFLIYKITEKRYNNNRTFAFIASLVFAVMPATWLLRRIWLDSIQLPLLLSSILFAVFLKESSKIMNAGNIITGDQKKLLLILLSGIFLGVAIFTKIPAFTFIPLVGYLVFTSSGRSWKKLGVWFIPVIGIPLLWPAYAMSIGGLDEWLEGFFWQASGRIDRPLWMALEILFEIDPVLLIIGSVGILIAAFKRDFFFIMGRTIPCTFASFRICFILVLHSNFACIRCRKRLAYRKGSPTCSQSK